MSRPIMWNGGEQLSFVDKPCVIGGRPPQLLQNLVGIGMETNSVLARIVEFCSQHPPEQVQCCLVFCAHLLVDRDLGRLIVQGELARLGLDPNARAEGRVDRPIEILTRDNESESMA